MDRALHTVEDLLAASMQEDAARSRTARRWALTAERDGGTLAGVLVSAAETRSDVELGLVGGHRCTGCVVASGAHTTVVDRGASRTAVRTEAVLDVRLTGTVPSTPDAPAGAGFEALLRRTVEQGGPLVLWLTSGEALAGRAAWSGADCLAVQPDDGGPDAWRVIRLGAVVAASWLRATPSDGERR